ncbi:hypothetical protein [Mesorhizobium sp.]|uniref:hypothetical protein n=1 Tax=Mesorhizobium sp. TaxID=1871066 RepID=UPI0025E655EF|nr:hypothetical protein [Mesorhizobium sp.]
MRISGFFGKVASVTPSLVISFISAWSDIFTGTSILPPQYTGQVERTIIAVASFLTIICGLLFRTWPAGSLKVTALRLSLAAAILCAGAIAASVYLDHPRSRAVQELLVPMWDFMGACCIVAVMLAVLFATMFALRQWAGPEDPPQG